MFSPRSYAALTTNSACAARRTPFPASFANAKLEADGKSIKSLRLHFYRPPNSVPLRDYPFLCSRKTHAGGTAVLAFKYFTVRQLHIPR